MAEIGIKIKLLTTPEIVKVSNLNEYTLCIFDIETTTLFTFCEIIQISAICYDRIESPIDVYILPNGEIPHNHVTGISKQGGNLYDQNKERIPSVRVEEGLERFLRWMESFEKKVVLIAHNAKQFDVKHLLRTMEKPGKL